MHIASIMKANSTYCADGCTCVLAKWCCTASSFATSLVLGWLHRVEGEALEGMRLRDLVPTSDRGGAQRTYEYLRCVFV